MQLSNLCFEIVSLSEELSDLSVLIINQLASIFRFLNLCLKVIDLCLQFCSSIEVVRYLLVLLIYSPMSFLYLLLLRAHILLGLLLNQLNIRAD